MGNLMFEDQLWGKLRSAASRSAYREAWEHLAFWSDETRPRAIRYVLDWLRQNPALPIEQPVRYTAWFEGMLQEAMLVEIEGCFDEARTRYRELLSLKPDCVPAAIALHRLRGRQRDLLEYCCDHPWEKIEFGTWPDHAVPGYSEHAPTLWTMLLTGQTTDSTRELADHPIEKPADVWEVFNDWELDSPDSPSQFAFEYIPFLGEILYRSTDPATQLECAEKLAYWAGNRFWLERRGLGRFGLKRHLVDVFERLPRPQKKATRRVGNPEPLYFSRFCSLDLIEPGEKVGDSYVQMRIPSPFFTGDLDIEPDVFWQSLHPAIRCIKQAVLASLPLCIHVGQRSPDAHLRRFLWDTIRQCGPFGMELYKRSNATFGDEYRDAP